MFEFISYTHLDLGTTITIIKPLMLFVAAMVVYSIFIFKFYRFLAKKDIIEINLKRYNSAQHWLSKRVVSTILYVIEYIIFMPIFVFFWFGFFVVLIAFLSENMTIDQILLVAIALVGSVRVVSYYNEELSKDLAKMLPLALLGVFIIDMTKFSYTDTIIVIQNAAYSIDLIIYYLGFIVFLEFILRIGYDLLYVFLPHKEKEEK